MAERPVNFTVTVEGADEAAAQFDRLTDAQREVSGASREMGAAQQAASGAATAQSVASLDARTKIEQLGGTIGQVGAVLGRINPKFARMGATIGTVGASLPALTGSLGPFAAAIAAVTLAVDIGSQAMDAWQEAARVAAEEARITAQRFDAIGDAAKNARDEVSRLTVALRRQARARQVATHTATQQTIEEQFEEVEARRVRGQGQLADIDNDIERRTRQLARLEATRTSGGSSTAAVLAAREEQIAVGAIIENMRAQRVRVEAGITADLATQGQLRLRQLQQDIEDGAAEQEEADEAAADRRRASGASSADRAAEAAHRESLRVQAAEQLDIERAMNEEHARRLELMEAQQRTLQEQIELAAQQQAQEEAHAEGVKGKMQEAEEHRQRRVDEAKAQQRDARAQLDADAQAISGPVVSGITDALSSILAGTKSADEAFSGLLASFLQMIAEQAALEAAKEFAAAIGSFASQDYGGGALHLAAGVAWTGVAVAAGAGSIAVAPSAATPAAPETAQDTGGGGGGDTVYNINGTIISAAGSSDRARAGREVGALVGEGERRFGRAG